MNPIALPDNSGAAEAATPPAAAAVRLESDDAGIRHIVFDAPGTSANLFHREALLELETCLLSLAGTPGVKGLVLRSAKPGIFIAGADLKAMLHGSPDEIADLVALGQRVFNRLADLPFPKVAAIHGACLGGGLEVALACDRRIASSDPATKIGLPETQLGLIPAWGGSTRLPKLVGIRTACQAILKGAAHPAEAARRLRLVDEVVPPHCLVQRACEWIESGGKLRRRPPLDRFASPLIRRMAHRNVQRTTHGNFPALPAAIEVVTRAPWRRRDDSLAAERAAFAGLVAGPEVRNLTGLFFARERARKLRVPGEPRPISSVAVIGAGVMGSGIAWWLAARGIPVTLTDISHDALAKGAKRIDDACAHARRRRILPPVEARRALDRIVFAINDVRLDRVDLAIEAAVEDPGIKRRLFADLAGRMRPDALTATNTSAIPVHTLTDDPRLVGLHFFNPVHAMPLVEVVRTSRVPDDVLATAVAFVQRIGKLPLVVADSPGFLVNRVLMPWLMEAAAMVEEGHGIRSVDEAMLAFGMPMGPLRLLDEVGLDVALHVAGTLSAAFPWLPPAAATMEQRVKAGRLGRKSGAGYYQFGGRGGPAPSDNLPVRQPDVSDATRRLPLLLTNEAARCLDEGVAATAGEIDAGMVLGTGYAPFRGGPLRHADQTGLVPVVNALRRLADSRGALYEPARGLVERADGGRTFHDSPTPTPP